LPQPAPCPAETIEKITRLRDTVLSFESRAKPMKFSPFIRLSEIPEEGKSYLYNSETKELNKALAELVKDQKYEVNFFIKPVNNRDYMMTGSIETQLPSDCSLCGLDFKMPIKIKINEYLIPHQASERKGHYAKVNHLSDADGNENGTQALEYPENEQFDMGAYAFEAIAIMVPFSPVPETDKSGDCKTCGLNQTTHNFGYDEKMDVEKKPNPFAEALKNLKI
jgi:uncharacterized protein